MSGMELATDDSLGTVYIPRDTARSALAYLVRHDATDLTEALGLTGHAGINADAKQGRYTPVWRQGALS